MIYALLGLLLGVAVAVAFRLAQGRFIKCPSCGKKHWVGYRVQNIDCQQCGSSLFKGGRNSQVRVSTRKKKPAPK